MSNFIQCNTETGEVIYVNLDLVLKVRVLKSKGTQITFVNGDKYDKYQGGSSWTSWQ
jgi:hypothetical protein